MFSILKNKDFFLKAFFVVLLFSVSFPPFAMALELPEGNVFVPMRPYAVYEGDVKPIPVMPGNFHVILRSDSDEGSQEGPNVISDSFHVILSDSEGSQEDPSVITLEYWNSLTEEQQKILHYYRNEYQGDLPLTEKELIEVGGDWSKSPCFWCSTHKLNGAVENIDYRGRNDNAHKQLILDKDKRLVTTPENMGTYDFGRPPLLEHYIMDIEPWLIYGNSPEDTTTYQDRVEALGELTFLYYNYKLIKSYE